MNYKEIDAAVAGNFSLMRHLTVGHAALGVMVALLAGCGGSAGRDSSSSAVAVDSTTSGAGAATGNAVAGYTTVDGTAKAGSDYQGATGSVTWADGDQAPKTISVPVAGTAGGKSFAVDLTSVSGEAVFGSPTDATVDISTAAAGSGSSNPSGDSTVAESASASGSMIPSVTQLVDAAGNTWTVSGGVISLNGSAQTITHKVIVLLYYSGVIYQENSDCLWWSWTSGAWVASARPAAAGIPACSSTVSSAGSGSSSASTTGVPAPAAAVGYNTLTFSSNTLGTTTGTWQRDTFYGDNPLTNCSGSPCFTNTQNGSASFTMVGGGRSGADVDTAVQTGSRQKWTGVAFGGGMYTEATMSFTGQTDYSYPNGGPAFWMLDIEHTSVGPYNPGWPAGATAVWNSTTTYVESAVVAYGGVLWISLAGGNLNHSPPNPQSSGPLGNAYWNSYNDFFEVDNMEYDAASSAHPYAYQIGVGNWYGNTPLFSGTQSTSYPSQCSGMGTGAVCPPGTPDYSQPHRYGTLWVPATGSGCSTTTQGYLKFYFDRVQIGSTFTWNYYDPTQSCYPSPPPSNGTTAMAGMDLRHMFLILGSDVHQPTTVYAVNVWQTSGAHNLIE